MNPTSPSEISFDRSAFAKLAEEVSSLVDSSAAELLQAGGPIENLHDAAAFALGLDTADPAVRGKRIRPALCVLVCEALGGNRMDALPFGVAIELLHNFALVHDDIEDGDEFRRGRPAVWIRYGLPHAVNVGDYLLSLVYTSIIRGYSQNPKRLTALLETIAATTEPLFGGQALDMNARSSTAFDRDAYNAIVSRKTGSYLAAPLVGGAIIAGADGHTLAALREYGNHVGPLFQIKDDLIDLTEGKGRESVGNDIREGKRSYLVALFSERASKAEHDELFTILDKPRAETSEADVQRAAELFCLYDVLSEAEAECARHEKAALQCLDNVPAPLRNALTVVTRALVERKN